MKKNKKANTFVTSIIVISMIALVLMVGFAIYEFRPSSQQTNGGVNVPNPSNPAVSSTSCQGSNPSYTIQGTDALTGGSVTMGIRNAINKGAGGGLLGANPTLGKDMIITPIINASGYLPEIKSDWTIACGPNTVPETLYQFQNESAPQVYNNAGTGVFSGNLTNETVFTTQANNKITLTGNTFRSTGNLLVIVEVSNVTSVQAVNLNQVGGSVSATPTTTPGCYSPLLPGNSFKASFEIPASATLNGGVANYNINTVASAGLSISGREAVTVCNEQIGIDSLNSKILTSGICDSGNKYFGVGAVLNSQGVSTSTTLLGCQSVQWSIGNTPA
jgi:hypothetical protein